MINRKFSKKIGQPKQQGLWENILADPGPALKSAMNESIKACSLSREQIIDEMNRLSTAAGITCNGRSQKVTTSVLNKWCAPAAKSYHIPLRLLPVFCRVVGDNLPLKVYSTFFQEAQVISKEALKKLQWAEVEIEARKNRKQASRLAQEVGL